MLLFDSSGTQGLGWLSLIALFAYVLELKQLPYRASLWLPLQKSFWWWLWSEGSGHSTKYIVLPRSQWKGQLVERSCLTPAQVDFIADLVSPAMFSAYSATSHSLVFQEQSALRFCCHCCHESPSLKYDFASAFNYCLMRAVSLHVPCILILFDNMSKNVIRPCLLSVSLLSKIVVQFEGFPLYGQFLKRRVKPKNLASASAQAHAWRPARYHWINFSQQQSDICGHWSVTRQGGQSHHQAHTKVLVDLQSVSSFRAVHTLRSMATRKSMRSPCAHFEGRTEELNSTPPKGYTHIYHNSRWCSSPPIWNELYSWSALVLIESFPHILPATQPRLKLLPRIWWWNAANEFVLNHCTAVQNTGFSFLGYHIRPALCMHCLEYSLQ